MRNTAVRISQSNSDLNFKIKTFLVVSFLFTRYAQTNLSGFIILLVARVFRGLFLVVTVMLALTCGGINLASAALC